MQRWHQHCGGFVVLCDTRIYDILTGIYLFLTSWEYDRIRAFHCRQPVHFCLLVDWIMANHTCTTYSDLFLRCNVFLLCCGYCQYIFTVQCFTIYGTLKFIHCTRNELSVNVVHIELNWNFIYIYIFLGHSNHSASHVLLMLCPRALELSRTGRTLSSHFQVGIFFWVSSIRSCDFTS
jgi:hypothetical protein